MGLAELAPDPLRRWDIVTPSLPGPPGVIMSGFTDRSTAPLDLDVVPYPSVTIAIDLCDDLIVVDETADRDQSGTAVFGLGPRSVRAKGRSVRCMQVRMSPVMAHSVLGTASDLDGELVGLDDLWGREASLLREQLRDAPTWDARFAIAGAAISQRVEAGRAVDPELAFTWEQMVDSHGQIRVGNIADDLGWSRKRLWSRFRSQLGLTPKRAAQLIRFDRAAHRLAAGHSPASVAAECGYADQSHLHREVSSFTGQRPSAVSSAPWLAVDHVAWTPQIQTL